MTSSVIRRELKRVGRYDLLEAVGKGGCGSVYRAVDRESGATVAVKVLAANLAENPKLHYRFAQEFQAATRLEHPNIVRALDFDIDGPMSYLVMEFVEGPSLGDRIDRARAAAGRRGGPDHHPGRAGPALRPHSGRSSTATSSRTTSWSAPTGGPN